MTHLQFLCSDRRQWSTSLSIISLFHLRAFARIRTSRKVVSGFLGTRPLVSSFFSVSSFFCVTSKIILVMEEWDSQSNRLSIDRQDIETEQTSKAIYAASELLLDKEGSLNIISELHNLFQYIKFPPVGLGVLRWVEYITTPKYLEKQIESTPISLALIDEVAICHPQLHYDVTKLLVKLLESSFPALDTLILLKLKKSVLGKVSKNYSIQFEAVIT